LPLRPLWLALSLACGCQGPLSSGIRAFEESRFVEAAATLRQSAASDLDATDSARWALYLGLTELSLGNVERAVPRLCQARRALEAKPAIFSPSERGQLETAWHALGKMPGEPLSRAVPC
jgi:hypothetical protein